MTRSACEFKRGFHHNYWFGEVRRQLQSSRHFHADSLSPSLSLSLISLIRKKKGQRLRG